MSPEKLLHLLVIERSSHVVTASGGKDEVWVEIARTRAELAEGGMTEAQGESGTVSTEAYTFRARWTPGITLADRVIHDGRTFDIIGLAEIGRRSALEIRLRRTGP